MGIRVGNTVLEEEIGKFRACWCGACVHARSKSDGAC